MGLLRVLELHLVFLRFLIPDTVSRGGDEMKCHTPGCDGEHETRAISHSVVYRERTLVVHGVPADVCPDCGDAVLAEETAIHLELLLRRKTRGKAAELAYGT
jgi:YgiT-type zinc finger domain-containing protein